ncbi:MAG: outer membrane beta-barrel protein [Saprospiraceae bacterium]
MNNDQLVGIHSVSSRYEKEFSPNDRLILKLNFKLSNNSFNKLENITITDYDLQDYNHLDIDNDSENTVNNLSSAAIYRHLFKKKGRSFAISGGYNLDKEDGTQYLNTLNSFFNAVTPTDQIKQFIDSDNNENEYKSSLLYTEPLFNKFYGEVFYNFSDLENNKNRQASDLTSSIEPRIDSLSVYYEQQTLYNRIGAVLRYSNNGLNGSIGVAAQNISLNGKYAVDEGEPWYNTPATRNYFNVVPNVELNYEVKRGMHIDFNYTNDISTPDFNDLYPVTITTNPSYVVIGNPDLNTSINHSVSLRYGYWNPANFSSFHISTTYDVTLSPIVYNQKTEISEDQGIITISYPENMDTKTQYSSWLWANIPIIKTKLSINGNLSYSLTNSPIKINDELDATKSNSYYFGVGMMFSPGQKFVLNVGANANITDMNYDLLDDFDQNYYSYNANSSVKWQFLKSTFFESNFKYSVYVNDKYDFDQKFPVWNASIRQLLGKSKKFELRLAALDILNKNVTINQTSYANYLQQTETNTLTRYIMLSLTYNIKGFETKMERRGRFH